MACSKRKFGELEESDTLESLAQQAADLLTSGLALSKAGQSEMAFDTLLQAAKLEVLLPPFHLATFGVSREMPLALVLSVAHHALGDLYMERATEQCPQQSLSGPDCVAAWDHLQHALKLWPQNPTALSSLASLHHNKGDLLSALECFSAATSPSVIEGAIESASWAEEWVLEPYYTGLPFATFMKALLLSILGRHTEAIAPLQRLGMRKRLAPIVWKYINKATHPNTSHPSPDPRCPVKLYANAIPEDLWQSLAKFFGPGAAYWRETDYDHRGYFGFWYDVTQPPTNAVECLIQKLLPLSGCQEDVVGTEWWVNTRLAERDIGHQLHYDTEAESITALGYVPHPITSSVCYITGTTAGPTIVVDQTEDGPEATRGWLVYPQPRAFMTFPGDRLHGVMPICPDPASAGQPATQRVTLMIGFWGIHTPSNAPRFPLGPCGPLPEVTATCTWPRLLACDPTHFTDTSAPCKVLDGIQEVSPVWEDIPPLPDKQELLALPDSIDLLFFARDHSEWSVG